MSEVKYIHVNTTDVTRKQSNKIRRKLQSRTVAVKEIKADDLLAAAGQFVSSGSGKVSTLIGVARLSVSEKTYSKAIGRQESSKQMSPMDLDIVSVARDTETITVETSQVDGVTVFFQVANGKTLVKVFGVFSTEL